jgi:hypothetical protein
MRLALWTPRPAAAWVEAILPRLRREADVTLVGSEPASRPASDLDLYHVADDAAHGFVYRALRERPGLVLLADWGLGRLVRAETAGRGDVAAYLAEARRAHGETGAFLARQELSGLGGEGLPALLLLNDRVLEASLGIVAFTGRWRARAAARRPGISVVHLPLAFLGQPGDLPDRASARAGVGVPAGKTLVAVISAAGAGPRRALATAQAAEPDLVLRPWPDEEGLARRLLAAADVAVALEDPPGRGLPAPVVRAVAAGVPTLISAGAVAAAELPEGVVAALSPGPTEGAELLALLLRLARDARLRGRMAALARDHTARLGEPAPVASRLLGLARDVAVSADAARDAFASARAAEATPLGRALSEIRWAAGELGLPAPPPDVEPLLTPVLRCPR